MLGRLLPFQTSTLDTATVVKLDFGRIQELYS